MITTGSKFFYALAALLVVTAVVYGYTTGGGGVGPISVGYKGGVGDHLGYTILLAAAALSAFLGFSSTAFRDADPEAAADLLGVPASSELVPNRVPTPGTSYWPVVGAFGVALTVVGVAFSSAFFVAGLIVLGAVAIEWTMQAWSDRATGDPAVNREIRNRIMLPFEVPIAGVLVIAVFVLGFSRVFLTASAENAVWIAIAVAGTIFLVGTILSTRDRLRSDLVAGLLAVAALVTIALGIFGAARGEREFEHHETDVQQHSDDGGNGAGQEVGAVVLEESN